MPRRARKKPAFRSPPGANSQHTKRAILDAAREEFAEKGFAGTRIDAIAKSARINKQALYYHFGSKERLYSAVLEDGYSAIYASIYQRIGELNLASLTPTEVVKALAETFFDKMMEFPQILEIISDENKYQGVHLREFGSIRTVTQPFISDLRRALKKGSEDGSFRSRLDPVHVWISIVSVCQFWWHHRYTLSHILDDEIAIANFTRTRRKHVIDFILAALRR